MYFYDFNVSELKTDILIPILIYFDDFFTDTLVILFTPKKKQKQNKLENENQIFFLKTLEWWISRLMLDLLFFINLQIKKCLFSSCY